jgi:hypothetical protein
MIENAIRTQLWGIKPTKSGGNDTNRISEVCKETKYSIAPQGTISAVFQA